MFDLYIRIHEKCEKRGILDSSLLSRTMKKHLLRQVLFCYIRPYGCVTLPAGLISKNVFHPANSDYVSKTASIGFVVRYKSFEVVCQY